MKQLDITTTYGGITITLHHNWITNEWAALWTVDFRNHFCPGFATSDKALDHAKRIISGEFEPIAKGMN